MFQKKTKDYNQKTEKKYKEQIAKKDLYNNVECSDYVAMHWPKLIKALKEKDSDAIYELLCPYLQKEKGTKEKIQQMLDKIDGNIVSNDDPSEFGYSYLIDHPIPYYWEDDVIRNIKTDKGKVYSVDFEFYVFYKKNHDYEGIVQMSLYNSELPDTERKIACIEDKKVMHELESTKSYSCFSKKFVPILYILKKEPPFSHLRIGWFFFFSPVNALTYSIVYTLCDYATFSAWFFANRANSSKSE